MTRGQCGRPFGGEHGPQSAHYEWGANNSRVPTTQAPVYTGRALVICCATSLTSLVSQQDRACSTMTPTCPSHLPTPPYTCLLCSEIAADIPDVSNRYALICFHTNHKLLSYFSAAKWPQTNVICEAQISPGLSICLIWRGMAAWESACVMGVVAARGQPWLHHGP